MSKVEKFGLISGILGVIVDTIAIIGYISGLINFGTSQTQSSSNNEPPTIFVLSLAIIIIYSWIAISWALSKRTITTVINAKKKYSLDGVVSRTVFGVGLVITPMILGWFVIAQSGGSNSDEIRSTAIIYATQTAQVMEIPAVATRIAKTQEAGGQVVIQESVESLERDIERVDGITDPFIYIIAFPFFTFLTGLLVYGIIYQLLPIVHPEISN